MTEKKEWKKLGFGTMRLPLLDAEDPTSIDYEQVCRMMDAYLEQGFCYVDTAYMYHKYESERMVKRALTDRYPRDRYVLADKMPVSHLKEAGDLERIFEEQLEKCGVEYFDYYLLHNISRTSWDTVERLDAFAFMRQKKAEGKIGRLGFSYHADAELLEKILKEHPEVEFVQLQINYLDWESAYIQSRLNYEVCVKYGRDVIVMEPVKGGALAAVPQEAEALFKEKNPELSVPSWAVRFAAGLDHVIVVLSGMSSMEQLLDNTAYMKDFKPLSDEEKEIVTKAAGIINAGIAIGCTGCSYCVEGCPKNIAIPEYFALYNQKKRYGGHSHAESYYKNYLNRRGRAGDCIGCRKCERICPQHLPVSELMKDVSTEFDGK